MYVAVVVATIAAHFAYMAYLVVGGVVALRWRRTIACHVSVVAWAILSSMRHLDCPLTWLERWGRAHAGMAPLPDAGFIAHYITGVMYPTGWSGSVLVAVFVVIAVSWFVFGWQARHGVPGSVTSMLGSDVRTGCPGSPGKPYGARKFG
ncbi:hypothetical protein MB901379_00792 [Mycobacterium basiliense]|uniref:DUF2784 domain-containing protein n=1 Tax=Mycobacterium basiliense TaxID=2094119 RepID=A0A447G9U9_9MYCO|nr:DUF2784 domain-containing protein [Mycobacterium basiliense]VDM87256.1 hypothetical protein MB901379_00792 [Mycobacterium basiliense]